MKAFAKRFPWRTLAPVAASGLPIVYITTNQLSLLAPLSSISSSDRHATGAEGIVFASCVSHRVCAKAVGNAMPDPAATSIEVGRRCVSKKSAASVRSTFMPRLSVASLRVLSRFHRGPDFRIYFFPDCFPSVRSFNQRAAALTHRCDVRRVR
jgi:hypothetical protein